MPLNAYEDNEYIVLPIGSSDRVSQSSVSELLPQELYQDLARIVAEAVPTVADGSAESFFEESRVHRACLIQGGRGVGKSTVLLNLPLYLKERSQSISDVVHVLRPVDPTQLEEADDLFLNMIVAAILSDEQLKQRESSDGNLRASLYQALQDVGHHLEARQTSSSNIGIDKLRSFIGSKRLAYSVHRFFHAALQLLGKRLLVLPIDDVDTTLHRAFENLEVVRRYLSSSLVLPIVCGDLRLYREVIRRDFMHRLITDDPSDREQAKPLAAELAVEYDRKVLPLHYRLEVPPVQEYLRNQKIRLQLPGEVLGDDALSLPDVAEWIRGVILGPVNGIENSDLSVPIHTVRALSQLLEATKDLLPSLRENLRPGGQSLRGVQIRRALLMPLAVLGSLREFESAQVQSEVQERRDSRNAYRAFKDAVQFNDAAEPGAPSAPFGVWLQPLVDHFKYEPSAGAACLVLDAALRWNKSRTLADDHQERSSVFEAALFLPHLQNQRGFLELAERGASLRSWKEALDGRLPRDTLDRLPVDAILPFAAPEAGRAVSRGSDFEIPSAVAAGAKLRRRLNLIIQLLLHRDYYSANKRAPLVLSGRLLELVVTSLVRDLHLTDLQRILVNPPFHSAAAVAPTKTLTLHADETVDDERDEPTSQNVGPEDDEALIELVNDINAWRKDLHLEEFRLSPWLIYNALNKTLNQVWFFNAPLSIGASPSRVDALEVAEQARMILNSFWAAVGSFEKGPVFGLPAVVSMVNIGAGQEFVQSDLYRQNIAPFFSESDPIATFGLVTNSTTFRIGKHPLYVAIRELPTIRRASKVRVPTNNVRSNMEQERQARIWLRAELGGGSANQLSIKQLTKLLEASSFSVSQIDAVQESLRNKFPLAVGVLSRLIEARAISGR